MERWAACLFGLMIQVPGVESLAQEVVDVSSETTVLVQWLLEEGRELEEISFAEVVQAVDGARVLSVDLSDPVDAAALAHLSLALDRLLTELGQPEHPVHRVERINEVSGVVEGRLQALLDAEEAWSCQYPRNAEGRIQRAGYPDLRLVHLESGKVFYVDPKLYREGSEGSSFRTFYFQPRRRTNKILDDAAHLLIGIAHKGRSESGVWQLVHWRLIDLHDFKVRLKAEFQASNRDIYREGAILLESGSHDEDP